MRAESVDPPPRGVWGSLLILALIWIGLLGGTLVGAVFFVPDGSGLAGPAIALGYGVGAAAAGVVAGGLVAWRARPETVRAVARPALLVSLLGVAVLGWLLARLDAGPTAGRSPLPARALPPN